MTRPIRLSDPKSSASALLRALVRAGQTDLPDAGQMQKVGARLGIAVGSIAGGTGGVGGGAGAAIAKTCALVSAIKVGAAVAVAVSVTGGVVFGLHQAPIATTRAVPALHASAPPISTVSLDPAAQSASSSVPDISISPTTAVPVVAVAATPPESQRRTSNAVATTIAASPAMNAAPAARDTAEVPPPPAPAPPAETEIALLQAAQSALRDSPPTALALADRHASRFGAGALAQEREVIAIEALLALHRSDEATERAARFAREFPHSAHRTRIEALLRAPDHNP